MTVPPGDDPGSVGFGLADASVFAASAFGPSAFGAALSEAPVTSGALKIDGIQSDDLGEGTAGIVAGADGDAGDAAIKVATGDSPGASRALASASVNV
jgi:hypothetical protein